MQDRIEMGLGMAMVHGGLLSVLLLEVNVMLETSAAAEEDVHLATEHRVSAERGVPMGTLKKATLLHFVVEFLSIRLTLVNT